MPQKLGLQPYKTVAIIGAGLSGLTMGYRLNQKGYDLAIYEARPRVGGRIHTVYVKNFQGEYSIAELGGQNITDGGEATCFLKLVKELGLETEDDPRVLSRGFYADGRMYDSELLLEQTKITPQKLEETLQTLEPSSCTMADVVNKLFYNNPLLKRIFTYYLVSYEGIPLENMEINKKNIDILRYFLPGGRASSRKINDNEQPFMLKYIKGGNAKLPLALAHILKEKIFLDKPLKKVSYVKDKIKLEFKDHTTSFCDILILSIPCSTYADIEWQNDILPPDRLDLIKKVRYGLNGKIVIPVHTTSKGGSYSSVNDDHIGTFYNNDYRLMVLYTDNFLGNKLAKKYDYEGMLEMIKTNYGNFPYPLPNPLVASEEVFQKYDSPVVKSWEEDIYAKGSYAAADKEIGSKFSEATTYNDIPVKSMFAPLGTKIFFVGEHTSLIEETGSMEAAVESAERLARVF